MPVINGNPEGEWGSLRMKMIVDQLRVYKPELEEPEEEEDFQGPGEIASSVGVPESRSPAVPPASKRAAVLICLFESGGEFRVLLTKRASSLSSHSGEVALPGGKRDEGDIDDAATAVREAHEEIGLDPSMVKVVASLEPFLSKHLFRVTPVVGILPDPHNFKPCCNAAEVESLFDAPLEMFLKDTNHRSDLRDQCGGIYKVHYFDFDYHGRKYVIWGLTAAILIRAASIVYRRPPEFEEFCPDFSSCAGKQYKCCSTLRIRVQNKFTSTASMSIQQLPRQPTSSWEASPFRHIGRVRHALQQLRCSFQVARSHEQIHKGGVVFFPGLIQFPVSDHCGRVFQTGFQASQMASCSYKDKRRDSIRGNSISLHLLVNAEHLGRAILKVGIAGKKCVSGNQAPLVVHIKGLTCFL